MANIPLTTFTWVPKSIYSTKIYQDLSFIMIYHHLQRSWSKISKFFRTRATSLPALPAGWRRQRTRHVQPMGRRHGWHDWHGHRGRNQRRLMDCHGAMIERSYLKLLKQILRIVCLFHDQNGICWILLICNMLWLYIYNIILYIYIYLLLYYIIVYCCRLMFLVCKATLRCCFDLDMSCNSCGATARQAWWGHCGVKSPLSHQSPT